MNVGPTCLRSITSLAILSALTACSGSSGDRAPLDDGFDFPEPLRADYDSAVFGADSAIITNPWLTFRAGRKTVREGTTDDGVERIETEVLIETRRVDGVNCAVVLDRAIIDGELVEETWDWFAQDVEGNVWYMGEDSNDYENGEIVSTAGSWEAGLDVIGLGTIADGGIQMYANPTPGQVYYQEYYEGEAIDAAENIDTATTVTLGDGTNHVTLKVREWNPYEPDGFEYKYYALNVGIVRETDEDDEQVIDLVSEQD